MKQNAKYVTGRKGHRYETQKQQREARGQFHPRGLARSVVHNIMTREDMGGVNKVKPGSFQSPFARNWRNVADRIASDG